ncbi:hypothetical protein FA95DRAFT_1677084 [Auriscalpium vulgare]|uniref:Uncharacterized protein n=1 Tax=Auriscalpium vulgare TaxID=40419 RepID=A0ACB8S1Q9_9AGAM|nr:hypothetical protein FA95DRAFT_1677084 [Auriscalpium vulgare]
MPRSSLYVACPTAILRPSENWVQAVRDDIERELTPLFDKAQAEQSAVLNGDASACAREEAKEKCERVIETLRNVAKGEFQWRLLVEVDRRLALLALDVASVPPKLLPAIVVKQQRWILEQIQKGTDDEKIPISSKVQKCKESSAVVEHTNLVLTSGKQQEVTEDPLPFDSMEYSDDPVTCNTRPPCGPQIPDVPTMNVAFDDSAFASAPTTAHWYYVAPAAPTFPTAAQSTAETDNWELPTAPTAHAGPVPCLDATGVPGLPSEKATSSAEQPCGRPDTFHPPHLDNTADPLITNRDIWTATAPESTVAFALEERVRLASEHREKFLNSREDELAVKDAALQQKEARLNAETLRARQRNKDIIEREAVVAQKLIDAYAISSAAMKLEAEVQRREKVVIAKESAARRRPDEEINQRFAAFVTLPVGQSQNISSTTPCQPRNHGPRPHSIKTYKASWGAASATLQEQETNDSELEPTPDKQIAERLLSARILEEQRRKYWEVARKQLTACNTGSSYYLQEDGQ